MRARAGLVLYVAGRNAALGLDSTGSLCAGRLFPLPGFDGYVQVQIDTEFTKSTEYLPQLVPLQRWSEFVYSFDGEALWTLRNGNYVDADPLGTTDVLVADHSELMLGAANQALQGGLDEIRVSRTFRPLDVAYADYLSMTRRLVRFVPPGQRP